MIVYLLPLLGIFLNGKELNESAAKKGEDAKGDIAKLEGQSEDEIKQNLSELKDALTGAFDKDDAPPQAEIGTGKSAADAEGRDSQAAHLEQEIATLEPELKRLKKAASDAKAATASAALAWT